MTHNSKFMLFQNYKRKLKQVKNQNVVLIFVVDVNQQKESSLKKEEDVHVYKLQSVTLQQL